jgi:hypothetical protein
MAKKRRLRKLQTARGAQAKARARSRRNVSEPRPNPSGLMAELYEVGELVIPAFAGYAGGRMISRITYVQLSKKYPRAAPHLAAGAGAAAVLAAYFALPRVKKFASYQVPATLGAAIASLQTIVQTYLPKFGWMVSDYRNGIANGSSSSLPASASVVATGPITAEDLALLGGDATDLDDESGMDIDPKGPAYDGTGAIDDDDFDDLGLN